MSNPIAVVLAAGKGTRMKTDRPKVLCEALGRPLVDYVLDTLQQSGVQRTLVVIGYRSEQVRAALAGRGGVEFVEQKQQLGTGHAVQVCREQLVGHDGPVLVVTGDSPLIQATSVRRLLDEYESGRPACILGTLHKADPRGLGRIVRDESGRFTGIVEEKDASDQQRRITEVNMSVYVFHGPDLLQALQRLGTDNRQGEYYLTDCPGILKAEGKDVRALPVLQPCEALSVNTLDELQIVEEELRKLGH
ncbi:MAG: NTP transferase domain-containing protein [Planctomycetes bacterium]|nr:NTP transferase domain-containing protein [Planctomycetota bacterium]